MSVLQTNAFPLGYSAVAGNREKVVAANLHSAGEMIAIPFSLSISKVVFSAKFFMRNRGSKN